MSTSTSAAPAPVSDRPREGNGESADATDTPAGDAAPDLVSEEAPAVQGQIFSDIEDLKEYLQDWAGDHGFAISCTSSRGGDYYTLRCKRTRGGPGGCPWTMVVRRFFFPVDKKPDGRLAWTTTNFTHNHPPLPRGTFVIHRRPAPEVREFVERAAERGDKPRTILNNVRRMEGCSDFDIDNVYYIVAQWRRKSRAERAVSATAGSAAGGSVKEGAPENGANEGEACENGAAGSGPTNGSESGRRHISLSPDSGFLIDPSLADSPMDGGPLLNAEPRPAPVEPVAPTGSGTSTTPIARIAPAPSSPTAAIGATAPEATPERVDARGRPKPWCTGCQSYIRHHGTCPREQRKRKVPGESGATYVDSGTQTEPLDIFKDPVFARQIAAILLAASESVMTIDIDAAALRAKYAEERDKRLAAPVGRNFKPLEKPGDFVDPHMPVEPREPVNDHVEFCYIGGGFSGLLTAARVKEAGVKSARIVDKAGDFGGVWYWNRYPGAMCDTAAMVYLPLLEETGYMPTHKYVFGPEIQEHCQRIARKYGLYDDALFHTDVINLAWEEDGKRWRIKTNRGDSFTASFVGIGSGPLNVAQLPDIPGIEKFKGKQFHTSRWEYEYTGGDRHGAPMTKLGDKRVGIVGTGATAVQCIPGLSRDAGNLFVFQRTPSAVDVRANHPFDPAWFKEISKEPGWHARWLQSFSDCWGQSVPDPRVMWEEYPDLVDDGWTRLARRWRDRYRSIPPEQFGLPAIMGAMEAQDNETMERIRARVDEIVTDKDKAAALKPWYRQLCKRPCFHDEYLQAFNKDSVHLVDTDGQGVSEVTETGVVVNGKHYELDCIVWASGFQFQPGDVTTRLGYDIEGPAGKLSDAWAAKGDGGGMRTLHGLQTAGFPNLFFQQLPQTGFLISNLPNNFVPQAANVAAIIAHAKNKGYTTVDAVPEAQEAWCQAILQHGRPIGNPECTPGYYNNEGKGENIHTKLMAGYPGGASAFAKIMEEWRAPGPKQFAGVTFA